MNQLVSTEWLDKNLDNVKNIFKSIVEKLNIKTSIAAE